MIDGGATRKLVRGLLSVTSVLVWTFTLFAMILYLFAVAGVEMIGRNPKWKEVGLTLYCSAQTKAQGLCTPGKIQDFPGR